MKKKTVILLSVVLAVFVIETIVLSVMNLNLRKEISKLKFMLYTPSKASKIAKKGSSLPNFKIKNINTGDKRGIIDMVDKDKLVLLIFSTDCYSCDQAAEIWNEIFEEYGDNYNIIGISKGNISAIENYMLRNNVKFPVFQYEQISKFDFFVTFPQTLLVDKNGRIIVALDGIPNQFKLKIEEES